MKPLFPPLIIALVIPGISNAQNATLDAANVMHTGDLFFNDMYPFIDVDNGGGIFSTTKWLELLYTAP